MVLRFDSEESALGWYNDPAYESVRKIRLDSCGNNNVVITKPFAPPKS